MTACGFSIIRRFGRVGLGVALMAVGLGGTLPCEAQSPIVKPGAPGEPSRELTKEEAIKVADTSIAAQCCDAGVCRRYDPQARALVPTSLISYVCTASGRMGVSGE